MTANERVTALIETARAGAELEDLGEETYREGIEQLVASLDEEAQPSELGQLALDGLCVANLVNRLRVTDWTRGHPELSLERVDRPVFILGLPRTGTTLLSYLLNEDKSFRSLMTWEATNSIPPPQQSTFAIDPRINEARDVQAFFEVLNPGFKAVHYEAPDGPTECVKLLAQDFKSLFWETIANVPSYSNWLLGADMTTAYDYHGRMLRLLQSEAPGRWVLKTPEHSLWIETVLATYPDASFVITHRDPVTVVASMSSLISSLTGTFSAADHRSYIVSHWSDLIELMAERVDAARAADPLVDKRFVDVSYEDLVAAPMDVVGRIYEHVGSELTGETESAMRSYLEENPPGSHGVHSYSSDDLRLDVDALRERFAPYCERHGIRALPEFSR